MKCLWYFIYVVSFHFTPKCLCYTLSLTGTGNDRAAESNRIDAEEREWDYTRQYDKDTKYNSNTKYEDSRFKGWNYIDTSEEFKPHKKTISLQVVDDPYYHGDRPLWPNDEYMYGYYGNYNRNGSGSNSTKPDANKMDYEWQNLPHRYGSYYGYPGYHTHHHHTAAATDVTKVDTTDAQGTNTDKRHLGYGYNGYGYNGYGYNRYPYGHGGDYFRGLGLGRKRVRLQIHPGLIAAPLAGFAAYKAASALNPFLVELGILDKGHGWGYGGGGGGGVGGGVGGGGHYPPPYYPPPAPVLPPSYPPPSYPHIPPVLPPIYGDGHTPYPILIPKRQETEKSSWWNPFSALTPRDEE